MLVRSALLVEHQGAARLLGRAVRRRRPDGRAGRAHPRPPRRDARVGRGRDRARPAAGRRLRPQRPVRRRDAPARHHARSRRSRSTGEIVGFAVHARAPLRRRRHAPGLDARRLDARSARRGSIIPPVRLDRGEVLTTLDSCSPTCARRTCGAATCARSSPRTASRSAAGELVERRGREIVRGRVRRGARLRGAADARGDRARCPTAATRPRASSRATASRRGHPDPRRA